MTSCALPADPELGYFGPGSATWKVMADPAAGAGGRERTLGDAA